MQAEKSFLTGTFVDQKEIDVSSNLPLLQKKKLPFYKVSMAKVDDGFDGRNMRESRKVNKANM
jgi:hypothetical protein